MLQTAVVFNNNDVKSALIYGYLIIYYYFHNRTLFVDDNWRHVADYADWEGGQNFRGTILRVGIRNSAVTFSDTLVANEVSKCLSDKVLGQKDSLGELTPFPFLATYLDN